MTVAAWKTGNTNPYLSAFLSSLKSDASLLAPAETAGSTPL
jgi:hypothetical protein